MSHPSPLPLYGLRHQDRLVMSGPLPQSNEAFASDSGQAAQVAHLRATSVRPRQSPSAPTHTVVSTPQIRGIEIRSRSTQITGRSLYRQASSDAVSASPLHIRNVLAARSLDNLHCQCVISAVRASIASARHAGDGVPNFRQFSSLFDNLQLSNIETNNHTHAPATTFVRILEVKLARAYDDMPALHDTTVCQFLFRRIPTWAELVKCIATFYRTPLAGLFLSYPQSSTTLPAYWASDTLVEARGPLGFADMLTRAYPDNHIEFAANEALLGTSHAIMGYGALRLRTIRSSHPHVDIPARPIIKQVVHSRETAMDVKEPEALILRHVRELRRSIAQSGMRRVLMKTEASSSRQTNRHHSYHVNPVQMLKLVGSRPLGLKAPSRPLPLSSSGPTKSPMALLLTRHATSPFIFTGRGLSPAAWLPARSLVSTATIPRSSVAP